MEDWLHLSDYGQLFRSLASGEQPPRFVNLFNDDMLHSRRDYLWSDLSHSRHNT